MNLSRFIPSHQTILGIGSAGLALYSASRGDLNSAVSAIMTALVYFRILRMDKDAIEQRAETIAALRQVVAEQRAVRTMMGDSSDMPKKEKWQGGPI